MQIVSAKAGETIAVGDEITLRILEVNDAVVFLEIVTPTDVLVKYKLSVEQPLEQNSEDPDELD